MSADGGVEEGDLLFTPSPERIARASMTSYLSFLAGEGLLSSEDYESLWSWSVADLGVFWSSLARFVGVRWHKAPGEMLVTGDAAEGARWGIGAELNYVDQVLAQEPGATAVIAVDESGAHEEVTYGELIAMAGAIAAGLADLGVTASDRVAAVLPNGIAAVASFLATASLGAIWSSCAPEFGAASMVDRFQQIAPKVLFVADGYRYGGKDFVLGEKTEQLEAALDGLRAVIEVPVLGLRPGLGLGPGRAAGAAVGGRSTGGRLSLTELSATPAPLEPVPVGFEHPLWILYSSGTTGLPKAIVHSHGGIVLEHMKALRLHSDLGPGDRFFWFTTTGWMMWNFLVGGLLVGTTIVCYDGSPVHPGPLALWQMAERLGVTYFGTSAPYLESCRKAGLRPRDELDLSRIHSVGSTGAPLPPEGFAWASTELADDVLVGSVSGGTDLCTAFLHACPLLPVRAGELQCAALGAAVDSYGPDGMPVVGEVGELVVTQPMPSMPVRLWGDEDGSRLHASYFDQYPGIWRHGDWVKRTAHGGYVVYGRSDATLNRGGVRMGTAELYRIVEAIDGVAESIVVDTSELGREGQLLLLVVPTGPTDAPSLDDQIRRALRFQLSPRHVPDQVIFVSRLPRTLNGKKVEVPLRRIILGTDPERAVSRDSLADPGALDDVLEALGDAGVL